MIPQEHIHGSGHLHQLVTSLKTLKKSGISPTESLYPMSLVIQLNNEEQM